MRKCDEYRSKARFGNQNQNGVHQKAFSADIPLKKPPPRDSRGEVSQSFKGGRVKMENNKKYTKGDKIYKFRATGSGKWTKYVSAIPADEMRLLEFAQFYGFVQSGNDTTRGGKLGDFFEIIKSFDFETLKKAKAEAEAEAQRISDLVLKSEKICDFATLSNDGSFKIDSVLYSNFWGNGVNRAEICEADEQAFKEASFLTKRQFYAPNEKITIVKFDAPKRNNSFPS